MERRGAHNILGQQGEALAAEFLRNKGYAILERNLSVPLGEVDILAQNPDGGLVVVEVKTLRISYAFNPIDKIDWAKRRKLSQLAALVAARYPDQNVQVDAVTVYWVESNPKPVVTHLENILTDES